MPELDYHSFWLFVKNQPYLCVFTIILITEFLFILYLKSESSFKEKLYWGLYLLTLRLILISILNIIFDDSTQITLSMSIFDVLSRAGVIDNIFIQFKDLTQILKTKFLVSDLGGLKIFNGFSRVTKGIKGLGALINFSSTRSVFREPFLICSRLPSSKCTFKLVSKSLGSKFQPNTLPRVLPSTPTGVNIDQLNLKTIISSPVLIGILGSDYIIFQATGKIGRS